jgi:hypothetical protein
MNPATSFTGLLLLLGAFAAALPAAEPSARTLAGRATLIRPTDDELRWQQIPWLTDLAEGQKAARGEQRPILLWVTGDDPLERC